MPRVALALVATVATVASIGGGVAMGGRVEGPSAAPFTTTPLSAVDTVSLTVPRAGFCSEVDEREVTEALGEPATSSEEYANGEEIEIEDGVLDVAHEFGCRWSLDDGTGARAWVFAPPVDRTRARRLIKEASRGCEPIPGAAGFGSPTVALDCAGTTSYRGLFGDAWLVCELTGPETARRADPWCSAVARAASSA